jgi:2-haloacid dehalogenase
MPSLTTAVFDLGNVLIEWHPAYLYRKMFATEADMDAFLALLRRYDLDRRLDIGESFAVATADLVRDHPEHAAAIAAYADRFDEMIPGPIEGTVALLQALRARNVPTYALSNWAAPLFTASRQRFASFMDGFKGILISGNERLVKPDPRFFALLTSRYGVQPARALFIDDRPENVAAAEALGFAGHLFTTPEALSASLGALALL